MYSKKSLGPLSNLLHQLRHCGLLVHTGFRKSLHRVQRPLQVARECCWFLQLRLGLLPLRRLLLMSRNLGSLVDSRLWSTESS
jgi:hypothetical protein